MDMRDMQEFPGTADRPGGVTRARFQILFGSASVSPQRMGWPTPDGRGPVDWYGWRLVGANNRELGRSAVSFVSYPVARQAVADVRAHWAELSRVVASSAVTGRWSWRVDFDGVAVAVSGRYYERQIDSRHGAERFVALLPTVGLADGVIALRERRDLYAGGLA
jgi:hypothetical protein